jgi:hypothetical protein
MEFISNTINENTLFYIIFPLIRAVRKVCSGSKERATPSRYGYGKVLEEYMDLKYCWGHFQKTQHAMGFFCKMGKGN